MVKDYNTKRKPIRLKEYGRNVQKLVDYINSEKEKEERSKHSETLIRLMRQIVPSSKDSQDNPQKFWDDMFIISDFNMDIDSPYPIPEREILDKKPDRLKYHNYNVRYKHYGHNIELLIQEAIKMEKEEEQQNAIIYIGSLMKTFHFAWGNELVDDSIILEIIGVLSKKQLTLKVDEAALKENTVFTTLYKERSKGKSRRNQGKGGQNRRRRN